MCTYRQILNTKETEQYSFIHQYEPGGIHYSKGDDN